MTRKTPLKYLEFTNLNDFKSWVKARNLERLYPITGNRASDGIPQPLKQKTVTYASAIENIDKESMNDLRVIARIEKGVDKGARREFTKEEAKTEKFFKDFDLPKEMEKNKVA